MVPVVLGLRGAPYTVTYLNYGYRRVAYHWIRLDELIPKMCFVRLLTPYSTIGTTETFMVPVVLGLGLAPYTVTYLNYGCCRVAYHWIRLDEQIPKMCLV
jgi:hypothetical protein